MITLAHDAAQILEEREALYGDMVESWEEVADLARRLEAPDDGDAERTVLVLIAMKFVRRRSSPDNPDHLRDAIGYAAILGRLRDRRRARRERAAVAASDAAESEERRIDEELTEEGLRLVKEARLARAEEERRIEEAVAELDDEVEEGWELEDRPCFVCEHGSHPGNKVRGTWRLKGSRGWACDEHVPRRSDPAHVAEGRPSWWRAPAQEGSSC